MTAVKTNEDFSMKKYLEDQRIHTLQQELNEKNNELDEIKDDLDKLTTKCDELETSNIEEKDIKYRVVYEFKKYATKLKQKNYFKKTIKMAKEIEIDPSPQRPSSIRQSIYQANKNSKNNFLKTSSENSSTMTVKGLYKGLSMQVGGGDHRTGRKSSNNFGADDVESITNININELDKAEFVQLILA